MLEIIFGSTLNNYSEIYKGKCMAHLPSGVGKKSLYFDTGNCLIYEPSKETLRS